MLLKSKLSYFIVLNNNVIIVHIVIFSVARTGTVYNPHPISPPRSTTLNNIEHDEQLSKISLNSDVVSEMGRLKKLWVEFVFE